MIDFTSSIVRNVRFVCFLSCIDTPERIMFDNSVLQSQDNDPFEKLHEFSCSIMVALHSVRRLGIKLGYKFGSFTLYRGISSIPFVDIRKLIKCFRIASYFWIGSQRAGYAYQFMKILIMNRKIGNQIMPAIFYSCINITYSRWSNITVIDLNVGKVKS